MKRILNTLIALCMMSLVSAQTPDIRIKTNIYETDGAQNSFTLVLGAAPGQAGYADIRCSGGYQGEAEIVTADYDSEDMALVATNVSCQVDGQGIVEVFCDEGVVIEYLSCTGAEITSVEFKNPENIRILALEHNALESFDLTPFTNIQALYLNDNPFNASPFADKSGKPSLQILELAQIDNIDPEFDITGYPNLVSFDAMSTHGLMKLTPSACPKLMKVSIDNTSVASLDVTQNSELLILNISETRISKIDLSKSTKLQQFYATHSSAFNADVKLTEIDVTNCPDLFYLFLNDNRLTSLDVTKCPLLQDLYVRNNYLTSLDLSQNPNLLNVFTTGNCMDFNTLPIPAENWGDYDYKQRAMEVPQSYLVGSPIDLSARVMRDDMETYATVFYVSQNYPEGSTQLDESLYTFENGILTINDVVEDSVYVSYYNGIYPDIELKTTLFKVKSASDFGQDDKVITISNSLTSGTNVKLYVGMQGATEQNPKKFYVQLGNSAEKKEYVATSENTPLVPNVDDKKSSFGTITIYVPEGEKVTAFKMADQKISGIDLSACRQLVELTLANTQLKKLDLQWNRCLRSVDITGNNFGADFTLAGANGSYGKNTLHHINLSNNSMTAVTLNEPGSWDYIDLSHNQLTDFNFTDADYVTYLDVSYNNFEYLKINYLGELKTFYCNNNQLNTLVLPETNVIETFNCANNCFTYTSLPERNGLDEAHFTYAPQADINIPTKGPGYNLSSQNVVIDGHQTVFTWKATDGTKLTEGVDYTCDGGITHFDDRTIGKTLYCELTNDAYPALSGANVLKTTGMYSAGMPTHLLASFTTPVGDEEVSLSLASLTPNNSIYIDWTGTKSLEQYPLGTTYTIFNATTTKDAKVNVWSYDEVDNISVFSMSDATLANVDCSQMKQLTTFAINNAGITELKMPEAPNLKELFLTGNKLTKFDFNTQPQLEYVSLARNSITELDLTPAVNLQTFTADNNGLNKITFGKNSKLWGLALSNNNLSEIDLSNLTSLYQVFLNSNLFSNIDLSGLNQLRVVYLDNNRFDFSNLPIPQEQWTIYTYGNQPELSVQPVNGIVDLSSQAQRDTVKTVYSWFYGSPTLDSDTGELTGELLIEGEEYKVENGVTTFLSDLDQVCCVLTNELFPSTYLITNIFAVDGSLNAIDTVLSDATKLTLTTNGSTITINGATDGATFILLTADGKTVARTTANNGNATLTAPANGTYIVMTKGAAAKVAIRK